MTKHLSKELRGFGLFLVFIALFFYAAPAQAPVVIVTPPDDAASRRLASFEKVWKTVNDRHFDPTFGGVDWGKIRLKYEPVTKRAASDEELHNILRQMLNELKLSHFGIHPMNLTAEQVNRETGYVGIDIIMIDGEPVVNRVDPGSPGDRAGVRKGFVISRIDAEKASEILIAYEKTLVGRALTEQSRKVYLERHLETRINGKPGSTVSLEFIGGNRMIQQTTITREEFKGEMSRPFGNFPAQQVHFESRSIAPDIVYVRFNMWVMPQLAKLRNAVRDLSTVSGLVIDLRGNPGGIGAMAPSLAGYLVSEKASLGTMRTRERSIQFLVYPQINPFRGKVVILTDHGTASTSEVFAAGMRDIGRATLIGGVSSGAVLPSVFETLPTGALFQYAISDYRTPKDQPLEGAGVSPDIAVDQATEALLAGRDAQLERAVEFIRFSR
ncbi:S41 family peptidase [Leptolyngbya sp. 7M]|uniref:S41 family peptidase n=1 Tax=Leptolyngbya sp. 7M TaxID=2812896 RepID=UPI001B8D1873|nr:S41 family peptidase [Leptolyngbya sp. 7M]QYO66048.1 hypothetical protein JVX88_04400 [Leptolyngbya sp. 7M]